MNALIEHAQVTELVEGVFSAALGLQCSPCEARGAAAEVHSAVSIAGAWEGEVTLRLTRALAEDAAARMFNVSDADVSKGDMFDAVGELSNQVAGSFKAVFPGPSKLSLPRPGTSRAEYDESDKSTTFWFDVDGEVFSIVLNPSRQLGIANAQEETSDRKMKAERTQHTVDFCQFLADRGLLDTEDVERIRARAESEKMPIGKILVMRSHLSVRQVMDVLEIQADRPHLRFGEIAMREGLLTTLQLEEALQHQATYRQHQITIAARDGVLRRPELDAAIVSYVQFLELQSAA